MKFRKKPVEIEAITFAELVEIGLIYGGAKTDNGMPYSFPYCGQQIISAADDCYLIPTLEGTMKFYDGNMLITDVSGAIYPCRIDIFEATYERCE